MCRKFPINIVKGVKSKELSVSFLWSAPDKIKLAFLHICNPLKERSFFKLSITESSLGIMGIPNFVFGRVYFGLIRIIFISNLPFLALILCGPLRSLPSVQASYLSIRLMRETRIFPQAKVLKSTCLFLKTIYSFALKPHQMPLVISFTARVFFEQNSQKWKLSN